MANSYDIQKAIAAGVAQGSAMSELVERGNPAERAPELLSRASTALRGAADRLGQSETIIARLRAENEALREALERIATLSDQREEPWPEGTTMDRLNFWRDRVIDAAEIANAALKGSRHE